MEYSVPSFENYEAILQHYRDFLNGKINECATHGGPVKEEILPQLLAINEGQIIAVDSQPGMLEKECKQRAYLDCLMKKDNYDRLFSKLLQTELVLFANPYQHSEESVHHILVTLEYEEPYTKLPIGLCNDMAQILSSTALEYREAIMEDLWQVRILDPVWGRATYLFDQVVAALY